MLKWQRGAELSAGSPSPCRGLRSLKRRRSCWAFALLPGLGSPDTPVMGSAG